MVSDLEKAFLNIKVKKGHRDALRFFWPENPGDPNTNSPLEVWHYRVVLFGSISSPFLLAIILEKIIEEDIVNRYVREMLINNIYVDNLNLGLDREDLLPTLYKESREVLRSRGFNLRKWVSNSEVIRKLAREEQVYDERE